MPSLVELAQVRYSLSFILLNPYWCCNLFPFIYLSFFENLGIAMYPAAKIYEHAFSVSIILSFDFTSQNASNKTIHQCLLKQQQQQMHQNTKATIHASSLTLHHFVLLFAELIRENPNAILKPASVFKRMKTRYQRATTKENKGLPSSFTFNLHKNLKYYTRMACADILPLLLLNSNYQKRKRWVDDSFRRVHKIPSTKLRSRKEIQSLWKSMDQRIEFKMK